jgi:hypothetical protein
MLLMPPGSVQHRIVPSEADEKGICPIAGISKMAFLALPPAVPVIAMGDR